MTPLEAALQGAAEIGFTVLSISMSLMAVFIPILLMAGYVGRLFREFAVTLSVAMGVSMVISLTTTPMMCALLLKATADARHGRLYRCSEAAFNLDPQALRTHAWPWCCAIRSSRCWSRCATVGLDRLSVLHRAQGLFPQQDTGRLTGTIQADQDISSQAMIQLTTQFANAVSAIRPSSAWSPSTGGAAPSTPAACSSRSSRKTSARPRPTRSSPGCGRKLDAHSRRLR